MANTPNSYSKTQWVNDVTKLNASNMNKIEQELSDTKESVIDNANSINEILAALNDYTSIRFSNGVLTLSIGDQSETPALTKISSTNIDLTPYATYAAMDVELDKRIAKALLTAKGDMIYASGNATPTRIGIGTDGQVLSVDGTNGVPKWKTLSIGVTNPNVSTSGSGNAVTAVSISNGQISVTKGTTFLTEHQDISGKVDKLVNKPTAGTYSAVTINSEGQVTVGMQVFEVIENGATPSVPTGGLFFEKNS